MSNFFHKASPTVNTTVPPVASFRIASSIDGKPIPVGYGKTRIPTNLIYIGAFTTYSESSPTSGGGGGGKGGFGGGGSASPGTITYYYSIPAIFALCEGPISANPPALCWYSKGRVAFTFAESAGSEQGVDGEFDFSLATGSYAQGASIQGLNYRGIAYVSSNPMFLGTSTVFPNFTFDIEFALSQKIFAYTGSYGADPRDIISDFLTNTHYGVGFPSARLDTNTLYSSYCTATGLVLSSFMADQRPAADWLNEIMQATNSEFIYTGGILKAIPYGDTNLSANGATYTVPSVTSYSLTDNDFIQGRSSGGHDDPVLVSRKKIENQINSIKVEYIDGEANTHDYNPAVVEAKDDAAIQIYGLRPKGTIQLHGITEIAAAALSAQLMLGREQILNTYEFTVSGRYILLDPMDIVTITDTVLGIQALQVRIKEITENDDYSLTIIAEDYPPGAAHSPAVATEPKGGAFNNYAIASGNIATPLIWEPTSELANGLFIWIALAGLNLTTWGGCEVWFSFDNETFAKQGMVRGQSRYGVLTADLALFPGADFGIVDPHTLFIDLAISQGSVTSASQSDVDSLASLLYVDGEYMAYRDVTPTGTYTFNLTHLVRAAYNTSPTTHLSGSSIARIDTSLFSMPYTQDRIGQTVYFKFLSFNKYGSAKQQLADVTAIPYVIAGTAFSEPLSDVTNFTTAKHGNITRLDWDPIVDLVRTNLLYEVRKGTSWDGGQLVGQFAHPGVGIPNSDTYWIKAFSKPTPGLAVYSTNASSVAVTDPLSTTAFNLLLQVDEGSAAPTGTNFARAFTVGATIFYTFTDSAGFAAGGTGITTTGSGGDFLALADVLAEDDILLNTGDNTSSGTWEDTFSETKSNNLRSVDTLLQISWTAVGVANGFGTAPDFPTAAIIAYPEVSFSTNGATFGAFQRYQPGIYNFWKLKWRMFMESTDPSVDCVVTALTLQFYLPDRIDHPLVNTSIGPGTDAITFMPDGASSGFQFNSGPNPVYGATGAGITQPTAVFPAISAIVNNLTAGDDIFLTLLSATGVTVQVKNAGVGVTRNVTLQARGF